MKTFAALIAQATSLSSASNSDCPWYLPRNDFLRQFGTSCYKFYLTQTRTRNSAYLNCVVKRGHLVDIHSQSEQDFIINSWQALRHQAPNKVGLWIGLSSLGNSYGTWLWASDYQGINYKNWAPYQPNNPNEHCGVMEYSGSSGNGKWHDYGCSNYFGWICEFPITSK